MFWERLLEVLSGACGFLPLGVQRHFLGWSCGLRAQGLSLVELERKCFTIFSVMKLIHDQPDLIHLFTCSFISSSLPSFSHVFTMGLLGPGML